MSTLSVCLSLTNAALLARAVIIKLTRDWRAGLEREGLESKRLERKGLQGLLSV
jgi:hypothetical protein